MTKFNGFKETADYNKRQAKKWTIVRIVLGIILLILIFV